MTQDVKDTAVENEEMPQENVTETDAGSVETKEKRPAKGEVKKLRAECAQWEEKAKEMTAQAEDMKDKYLRTLAEYDNYRKRTAKEREGIYADAYADCIKNLLPLLDNLERASQFTEGDQVAQGVKMILGTLPDILGKMNVSAFGAPGETFDPEIHNAVMHVDDEQYGEGEIVEVFQQGYKYGDKIIRYAMVRVAN
jgi:molecular chaperone GrpE